MIPVRRLLRAVSGARRTLVGARRTLEVVPRAIESILVLPHLARQLDQIVANTDVLPTISDQLGRVVSNTDHLTGMAADTGRLVDNTTFLPETHAELIVMRAAIVEVQGSTSAMSGDLSKLIGLEQAVPSIIPLLEDVDGTVRRLAEVMEPLQGATLRVGRLTDRLPSRASVNGR